MFAVVVTFQIKTDLMGEFLPLIYENAQSSKRDEKGCHQFDVCTDTARSNEVFLYELYTDDAAFEAHTNMPHYAAFQAAAGDMIADKDVRTFEWVSR